jgi:hypothetical protein
MTAQEIAHEYIGVTPRSGDEADWDDLRRELADRIEAYAQATRCTCLHDCDNCGAKGVRLICSGSEVCPSCFC